MSDTPHPHVLTTGTAAKVFQTTPETIRAWQRKGWLRPFSHAGRAALFTFDDLEVAVDAMQAEAEDRFTELRDQINKARSEAGLAA